MNLRFNSELFPRYKSRSQIVRVLSEDWCARELFCAACSSDRLSQTRANTPAVDFMCPECSQSFQLKSLKTWNPRKIPDAAYDTMVQSIRSDNTPNLLVLHYSADLLVRNLLVIPRAFLSESVIERRAPLSSGARRAGWVGCNILLGQIPADGKIPIVSNGSPTAKQHVRDEFSRVRRLGELSPALRGWTVDVLGVVRRLNKSQFTLREVYRFEASLKALHPANQNVLPKIRQQLQVLRDLGMIEFTGPGRYRLLG